jgi:hypothetical protein
MKTAFVRVIACTTALISCQTPAELDSENVAIEEIEETSSELLQGGALFVVGNTTLVPGDAALKARLEAFALQVTVKSGSAATTGDASGKRLVVISASVTSSDVNSKFRSVAVPVISYESAIFGQMGMTRNTSGTDFGATSGQTKLTILRSDPLSAGLTGTPTVLQTGKTSSFSWGKPATAAIKVARLASDATRIVIFRYDPGAPMFGLNAPAKRVGFFLTDATPSLLSASGQKLTDAAIAWAAGLASKKPNGIDCTAASQCASNICADGVCCNSACTGTCNSCNVAGSEGTCKPVPAGLDPKNQCAAEAATTCGRDGTCDGAGACRLHVSGTACSQQFCAGNNFIWPNRCDGMGVCAYGGGRACGSYTCDPTRLGCPETCASNAGCVSGYYCTAGFCTACVRQSPSNLIGDASFSEGLIGWRISQDVGANVDWSPVDIEGCSSSGSLRLQLNVASATVARCVSASAGENYNWGWRVRATMPSQDWSGQCRVSFHADDDCRTSPLVSMPLSVEVPDTNSWWGMSAAAPVAPTGTRTASFECFVIDDSALSPEIFFDNVYLSRDPAAF